MPTCSRHFGKWSIFLRAHIGDWANGWRQNNNLVWALNELNQPGQKIITVEDPVEYKLARINQVQVNPTIGLDFASVLRADCAKMDIILVGEIRDVEAAEISLRASMTGHLVLSTLPPMTRFHQRHDSLIWVWNRSWPPRAFARLLPSDWSGGCVASAPYPCALAEEQAWMVQHLGDKAVESGKIIRPVGCHHCNQTGFRGRRYF